MTNIDSDTYKKKLIEAEEFIKELIDRIHKRKKLSRLLIKLADRCDKHQHDAAITGVRSTVSLLTADGTAVPLVGVAAAAATIERATKFTHDFIDSGLTKDIDDLLADDKEAIKSLESRYNSLDEDTFLVSCLLLGLSYTCYQYKWFSRSQKGIIFEEEARLDEAINCVTVPLENIGTNVTESMLGRNWCAAFPVANFGVLSFSITEIVKSTINIHSRSKYELGSKVRYLVNGFGDQLNDAEYLIKVIKSHKIDDVDFTKKATKGILQTISERESGKMSEEEYKMITLLIKDWLDLLQSHNPSQRDEKAIIDCFVNLYRNTKEQTEQKNPESHLIFIILAHGTIFNLLVPSSSYYGDGSELITNVRLYAPWGALLNATAAASILMGNDHHRNMEYIREGTSQWIEAQVYNSHGSSKSVYTAETFNNLPQNDLLLPLIELTATFVDEDVIQSVENLMANNKIHPDHIVIPYFNDENSWMHYPNVPSYIVNSLLKIICWMMGFTCEIKSVHCLAADANSGFDLDKPVPTSQYWSTVPREQVNMCDNSFVENPNAEFLEILQKALNN